MPVVAVQLTHKHRKHAAAFCHDEGGGGQRLEHTPLKVKACWRVNWSPSCSSEEPCTYLDACKPDSPCCLLVCSQRTHFLSQCCSCLWCVHTTPAQQNNSGASTPYTHAMKMSCAFTGPCQCRSETECGGDLIGNRGWPGRVENFSSPE